MKEFLTNHCVIHKVMDSRHCSWFMFQTISANKKKSPDVSEQKQIIYSLIKQCIGESEKAMHVSKWSEFEN